MTASATDVKNRFGYYVEQAQREPVVVEKTGRGRVVILDLEEYTRLQAIEDRYWAEKAAEAERSGYVGAGTALASLNERLGGEE